MFSVKLNTSKVEENKDTDDHFTEKNSEELTHMIDRAIDHFFDNHIIRFSALGRETSLPIPNNGKIHLINVFYNQGLASWNAFMVTSVLSI